MWFKVDDGLHDHGKVRRIDYDLAAMGLWVLAGSWVGDNGTDGFVPASILRRWSGTWKRHAATLVRAGLWEPATVNDEAGWVFHDWVDCNPTEAEAKEPLERLRWRRKQALKKDRPLCEAVVARDRGMCRYCGIRVNWQDRKSAKGGTYDHVDPDGDNVLENVVVACRRCNGRKRDRTPTEAGIELLPVPGPYAAGSGSDQATKEPDASSTIKDPSLKAVRDQIGARSVRVGSRSEEPDRVPAHTNGASHD